MSDSQHPSQRANPIDPVTAGLIRCKTGQILRQTRLPRAERADVEQALTLALLQRLSKFDAAAGERDAFVRMVLRQATINVLRHYRAAKRSADVVSLEAFLRTETDEPLEPAAPPAAVEYADATIDVAAALAALPAELLAIAEELLRCSRAEAARNLGLARSTLNERVREIRAAFEARGLDDYV